MSSSIGVARTSDNLGSASSSGSRAAINLATRGVGLSTNMGGSVSLVDHMSRSTGSNVGRRSGLVMGRGSGGLVVSRSVGHVSRGRRRRGSVVVSGALAVLLTMNRSVNRARLIVLGSVRLAGAVVMAGGGSTGMVRRGRTGTLVRLLRRVIALSRVHSRSVRLLRVGGDSRGSLAKTSSKDVSTLSRSAIVGRQIVTSSVGREELHMDEDVAQTLAILSSHGVPVLGSAAGDDIVQRNVDLTNEIVSLDILIESLNLHGGLAVKLESEDITPLGFHTLALSDLSALILLTDNDHTVGVHLTNHIEVLSELARLGSNDQGTDGTAVVLSLLRMTLLGVALLRITALLGVTTLRMTLLRMALLRIAALLRMTLLRVATLLGIATLATLTESNCTALWVGSNGVTAAESNAAVTSVGTVLAGETCLTVLQTLMRGVMAHEEILNGCKDPRNHDDPE